MRKYVVWLAAFVSCALLALSSGCGSNDLYSADPSPSSSPSPPPTFGQVDTATGQLLSARSRWHSPKRLTVDEASKLALTLGEGTEIDRAIKQNVPDSWTTLGRTVGVGPDVKVTLVADKADAVVSPDGELNASTTSNVQLYYQWSVRPLSAAHDLALTAYIVVPLSGTAHEVTYTIPLNLPVDDTWSHRAYLVFTNWATWWGIALAVVGVMSWLWRRRSAVGSGSDQTVRSRRAGRVPRQRLRTTRGRMVQRPHH